MRKGGAGVLLPGRMCGCFRFLLKCGRQSCFLLRVAERPRQAAGEKGRIGDVGESEQENHRNQILRARFKYPAGEQRIEQDKTGQTQFTQGEGMTPVQGRNQNSGKHRRPVRSRGRGGEPNSEKTRWKERRLACVINSVSGRASHEFRLPLRRNRRGGRRAMQQRAALTTSAGRGRER